MTDKPQKKIHDDQFEEKAKERLKGRKEKAKKNRPEYKKKRVVVPVVTAVILVLTGIYLAIHATFFQSTDDAFVEGRLISVAPRVEGPVINLLVDDNDEVKAGQLLVEIDPADYEVKLHQAEAKLAEAKANGTTAFDFTGLADDAQKEIDAFVPDNDASYNVQDGLDGSLDAYGMMKCNLGWVDGKEVYYNSRDLNFVFTQEYSGLQGTLKVHQTGAAFDYKDVGSTYYQWGRKDPLVALRNWSNVKASDYRLHETSDPKYKYTVGTGTVSLGTAIQNPNIFYTRTPQSYIDWLDTPNHSLWDASSSGGGTNERDNKKTSVKTIYDPSPRGYKVPVPRAFSVLVNNGTSSTVGGTLNGEPDEASDLHNRYYVYERKNKQGERIPLTGTGQRADRADKLETYHPKDEKAEVGGLWSMYGVYYWSCIQNKPTESYTLVIRKDYPAADGGIEVYSYGFGGAKTMARPVRCIEDR